MNYNEENDNKSKNIPWYLSIWFIIVLFIVSFSFTFGIPAIILAIVRYAKYKENRVGSGILMGVTIAIPMLLIALAFLTVILVGTTEDGKYEEVQEEVQEEPEKEAVQEEPKETQEQAAAIANQEKKNSEEQTENKKQEYIFPDSNIRFLSEEEVKKLDADKLRIARNEIFARHGYIFQDKELQQYFGKMPWYSGIVPSEQFDMEAELNEYEKGNIELISKLEEGAGDEKKQDMKDQTSANAENAPYLSNEYLQYYIEKNNMQVNVFPESKDVGNFMDNYKGEAVSVEEETGLFKEPYYAMTRKETGLLYVGQMKDNKPDGIGALLKPVSLSIGENDDGELVANIYEYSGWLDDEDIYFVRIYMGNFKEGRPEGYGIEFSTPGDDDYFVRTINLNNYQNEEFQVAIFEMANPRRYEGGFKSGKYSGEGTEYGYMETYSYGVGSQDENMEEFEDEEYAELLGEEEYRKMQEILSGSNKDITIISGTYENGELNGMAKVYELEYLSYDGDMKNGEKNGKGIKYFSCSEQIQYEGEWAYGKYNGTGTLYNEDGSVSYSGKWDYHDYAH